MGPVVFGTVLFCGVSDTVLVETINPSIYNILRWVAWTMGHESSTKSLMFQALFLFTLFIDLLKTLYFCGILKKSKKSIEKIFEKNFARNHVRK